MLIDSLPFDISAYVVSNWLFINDLGRLDTAHCTTNNRSTFLGLLKSERFTFSNHNDWKCKSKLCTKNALFVWIKSRSIKLTSLSFHKAHGFYIPNLSSKLWIVPIKQFPILSHIQTLEFRFIIAIKESTKLLYIGSMISIIHSCPRLTNLIFEHSLVCNELLQTIKQSVFQRLSILHCSTIHFTLDKQSIDILVNNCKNLTSLKLSSALQHKDTNIDHGIISLICNNKELKLLYLVSALTSNDKIISAIFNNCKHIQEITICTSNQTFFDSLHVVQFLEHSLTILKLTLELSLFTETGKVMGSLKYTKLIDHNATHKYVQRLEARYTAESFAVQKLFRELLQDNKLQFKCVVAINEDEH